MTRIVAYLTGTLALAIVLASTMSAIYFAAINPIETINKLGGATLSGVGVAVGGCVGSALMLRFKLARRYVKNLVGEINEKVGKKLHAGS